MTRPSCSCLWKKPRPISTWTPRPRASKIYVLDPDDVGVMKPAIEEAADRPTFVTDWRQRNVTFFSALEVERNVMFIILFLIVLVAALNIISGMIMLVKDKGKDIAILRTMGATRGSIMRDLLDYRCQHRLCRHALQAFFWGLSSA